MSDSGSGLLEAGSDPVAFALVARDRPGRPFHTEICAAGFTFVAPHRSLGLPWGFPTAASSLPWNFPPP